MVGVLVVVGLVASWSAYNRFVRQRNLIDNSWSNVDTELKRRYDLIPNLVETVKGYATHERIDARIGDRGPQPGRRLDRLTRAAGRPARTRWWARSSRCSR